MPVERVSRSFKDLSMSFKANPLNDDLITLKNEAAIARSIRNIVFTSPGEKIFNPEFGSQISGALFELDTQFNQIALQDEIKSILSQFEPRIDNIVTTVTIVPDSNEMNATIEYDIVGLPTPPQIVDVLLFPARV